MPLPRHLPRQRPAAGEPPTLRLPRWKRAIDLAWCATALPVLALFTLVVATVMAVVSPGPIFFRQERVGQGGRRFRLYKFRTMQVSADPAAHERHVARMAAQGGALQKLDAAGDPRLIPGGWLLRASGLDELPQLLNVLRGDMSVVGPRPCLPYEYAQFTPAEQARFRAVPGLTGLWQVSGKNHTTRAEMIRLDCLYQERLSPVQDLWILLRTFPTLAHEVHRALWSRWERRRGRGIASLETAAVERRLSLPPFAGLK